MRTIFPNFSFKQKYAIDFSLVPIGVILLELSIFSTEFKKANYKEFTDLVSIRIVHTILFLIISIALAKALEKLGKTELSYPFIAILGTSVIAIGVVVHDFMATDLDVQTFSLVRQLGSGLLQGIFWFPAFLLVGSKRTAIFKHFKDYEQRLIVSTRARSRNSSEFRDIQAKIQADIKKELFGKCDELKSNLEEIDLTTSDLLIANEKIQALLKGNDLRSLSMRLENFGSERTQNTILGQNMHSLRLLANQFKILNETTTRIAPLKTRTYAAILIILVMPAFINYFTIKEALTYFPLLSLAIYLSSRMVTFTQEKGGPKAGRNSSLWLVVTGLMPSLFNAIGQSITHDPNTDFPLFVNIITLPLGYFIFMKVLQVLQPHAIDLVKNDQIIASKELKSEVTRIVSDEFSHTLAHRWAIFIHGKILTRLAATALKLETAKNSGDLATYISTIENLKQLLSTPDAEFEKAETNLESEIASRLDPWLGLVDVKLDIDQDLKLIRNARVSEVGEVIEEIISNSMRHGKAQNLSLRVRNLGENTIEILATDDSTIAPPPYQMRFGLGTRIFNLASDSRWSIKRVDSSTIFKLIMTIE